MPTQNVLSLPAYLVATIGFLLGAPFMQSTDNAVSFAQRKLNLTRTGSNERVRRIMMLG